MLWFGTSRQRPDCTPTSCPDGGGGGPATATIDRLSNCAVSPWLAPMPICPTLHTESVIVATALARVPAVIVVPENVSVSLCHAPVPGAATVPLRSTVLVLLTSFRNTDHAPVLLARREYA